MSSEAARPISVSRVQCRVLGSLMKLILLRAGPRQRRSAITCSTCYLLSGRNVITEPPARRELPRCQALARLNEPIREAPQFDASLPNLIRAVREQGLEGIVAKRLDSAYARPEFRRVAEHARQPSARVRDRRIHYRRPALRRPDLRILGGRAVDVRREDAKQVHSGCARSVAPTIPGTGDAGVSIRESAGGEGGALGRRSDGGEDEKLPVAESGPGGTVRVCGVDAG